VGEWRSSCSIMPGSTRRRGPRWSGRRWTATGIGSAWSRPRHTIRRPIRRKQDQPPAGQVPGQSKSLGSIIVTHPGHPLVGRHLPVVRRYAHRGERQWIIELADGSRQYLPASWCTPLARPAEDLGVPLTPPDPDPSASRSPAPLLDLASLRALAAYVRHLREREGAREGEQHDGATVEQRRDVSSPGPAEQRRRGQRGRKRGAPPLGELPDSAPPAPDPDDPRDGAPSGARPAGAPAARRKGVKRG
jgi:hypothetical protein